MSSQLPSAAIFLQKAQEVCVEVPILVNVGHHCHQGPQDKSGVILEGINLYSALAEVQDYGTTCVKPC